MIIMEMLGGLGNQMFVYAFARALNIKTGEKVVFVAQKERDGNRDYCTLDKFNISKDIQFVYDEDFYSKECKLQYKLLILSKKVFMRIGRKSPTAQFFFEKHLQCFLNLLGIAFNSDGYYPIKRYKLTPNFVVWGFFQSSKHFEEIRNIIQTELTVSEKNSEKNLYILSDIQQSEAVCVHIRRGDYTSESYKNRYLVCHHSYYETAMEKISKTQNNLKFFVFSDDIAWCKENVKFLPNTVFVDNDNLAHADMQLMYSCKHFIISNSSYSWWAQYLSKAENKIVYAPSKWSCDKRPTGVYQEKWNIIDV